MESNSYKTQPEQEKTPSFQEDIEKLRPIDPAFLELIQAELNKTMPFHEKALHSIKMLDLKDMIDLRSFMQPPEEVLGVLCAVMYLLAGNAPDNYIKADEKKNPEDLTWKGCQAMLNNRANFFEYVNQVGGWISEEKITYEMTVPIREYLEKSWFNKEDLKKVSNGAANIGEFVRNMIEYFDVFREVRRKVRARVEESARSVRRKRIFD